MLTCRALRLGLRRLTGQDLRVVCKVVLRVLSEDRKRHSLLPLGLRPARRGASCSGLWKKYQRWRVVEEEWTGQVSGLAEQRPNTGCTSTSISDSFSSALVSALGLA